MSSHPLLDPRDASARAALTPWIALQLALALRPQAAVDALRASRDPSAALDRLAPGAPRRGAPIEAARAALAGCGARLLPFPAPDFPWRLALLRDAPPVLAVRGDVRALSAPAVAIVGSRAASAGGFAVAHALAGDLARAGLVVVSGLARGIDAAAHEGALAAGGTTVAVQACGPERVYPAAHRGLAARIAAQGALITELPPGARPTRAMFPLRNRLIAGLSLGLVVVEARERSGSLVSARHALDQGIDVFAVPGPVGAPFCLGSNRLLRDGAIPALDASDVLGALGVAGAAAAREAPEPSTPAARAILEALARRPASRDELAAGLGRTLPECALALLELELDGRVVEDRDGRLRVIR